MSLGQLIRSACEAHYGYSSREARCQAVSELAALSLPVGALPG
ncbi:MAG: hypothetical protein AB1758_21515 [Candidatus Eremiobacterota bacterium]